MNERQATQTKKKQVSPKSIKRISATFLICNWNDVCSEPCSIIAACVLLQLSTSWNVISEESNNMHSRNRDAQSSSRPRSSSTEAMAGISPRASLIGFPTSPSRTATSSEAYDRNSTSNNSSAVMNPLFTITMRQQEEQQLMIAAARARASNSNLMAGDQYPISQEALLYQQALLGGRAALYPLVTGGAYYGSSLQPVGMAGFPFLPPPPPFSSAQASSADSTRSSKPMKTASKKSKSNEEDEEGKTYDYMTSTKRKPYFDGSTVPDDDPCSDEDNTTRDEEESDDKNKTAKARQNESFPSKLYRIIEDAKENGQDGIVGFFSHGRAFRVHKPRQFLEEILPNYMNTTRITSFQRQLNLCKSMTSGACCCCLFCIGMLEVSHSSFIILHHLYLNRSL